MLRFDDLHVDMVIWLYPWWYMDPRDKEEFLARVTSIRDYAFTVKALDAQGEIIEIGPTEIGRALGRKTARVATSSEVDLCLKEAHNIIKTSLQRKTEKATRAREDIQEFSKIYKRKE